MTHARQRERWVSTRAPVCREVKRKLWWSVKLSDAVRAAVVPAMRLWIPRHADERIRNAK